MNRIHWTSLVVAATILAALPAGAAVQVSPGPEPEPPKEQTPPAAPPTVEGGAGKLVAFQVGGRFLTANSGGVLDLSGVKIGSKQSFTVISPNGADLADGVEVRIQYTPGKGGGGAGDIAKSTFWVETPEGIKRKREGDSFKLKLVGTKYAFQTLKGKFVGQPAEEGALGLVEKQEGALLVDIVDLSHGKPKAPKAPKAPKPEANEAAAPAPAEKPAAD